MISRWKTALVLETHWDIRAPSLLFAHQKPLPFSAPSAGCLHSPIPPVPQIRGEGPPSTRAPPHTGRHKIPAPRRPPQPWTGPLAATNSLHDSLGSHLNKGTWRHRSRRKEISLADNYNGGSGGNNRDRLGPPPPWDGLCESPRNNCELRRRERCWPTADAVITLSDRIT